MNNLLKLWLTRIRKASLSLERWHANKVSVYWLQPMAPSRLLTAIVILFSCAVIALNIGVRYSQFSVWQSNKHITYFDQAPSVSTADAPYFLAHAKSISSGEDIKTLSGKRFFPNRVIEPSLKEDKNTIRDWPLLSVLIAKFTDAKDTSGLLWTAHVMLFFCTAATVACIIIGLGSTGYWLEACVGAIGGGLSTSYLVRSSFGRIDTDQLNLAFLYLLFGLVIFSARAKNAASSIAWCLTAGFVCHLFMWWYGKSELIFLVILSMAWSMIFIRRSIWMASFGIVVLILCSGISFFNPLDSEYAQTTIAGDNFVFPNALETVTEAKRISIDQSFSLIAGSVEMGLVCVIGFSLWTFRQPALAIAICPLPLFFFMNDIIGNRALFYAAPVFWFGMAFLITSVGRLVLSNTVFIRKIETVRFSIVFFCTMLGGLIAWVNSPTGYVPRPTFPKPVLEGFATLAKIPQKQNSLVATWWDYGYISLFLNGIPTLHDGGSQLKAPTHFVAKSLLIDEQRGSVNILRYLASSGLKGIESHNDREQLKKAMAESRNDNNIPQIYLVLTDQMTRWMPSISKLGNWDIELGTPNTLPGFAPSEQLQYYEMNCRMNGFPHTLECQGHTFDLNEGLVNGEAKLIGWTHSKDGKIVRKRSFNNDGHFAVQLVQTGRQLIVFLVHQQLYKSTFNKLFHFGQINDPAITLHYDNYPHIRIYKISRQSN